MRTSFFAALCFALALPVFAAEAPPREWIDPATGHRVVRLSEEPGTASLYFHQHAYSRDGRKIVVTTPIGISTIELATRRIEPVVEGEVRVIVVGQKSGDVYYTRKEEGQAAIYATNLDRDEWSVHFNVSPDGTLFAGDGGDDEMVAHAPDGKWIYLSCPRGVPDVAGIKAPNSEGLIHAGRLVAERLVNMGTHDYKLEPNVMFTPDMKWIVFRSNMHGATHVYAVEIAKAQ